MDKRVIIINGHGGVGKDTICRAAARFYQTRNISSITPIVEIAKFAGWDGEKTPAARRLLSRLKDAFTEWDDVSFSYCMRQYRAFLEGEEQLLFVHIREPEEIARFRSAVGASCRTLLVRRAADGAAAALGNRADDGVAAFDYDYYFDNDGALPQLEESVRGFLSLVLREQENKRAPVTWHFF